MGMCAGKSCAREVSDRWREGVVWRKEGVVCGRGASCRHTYLMCVSCASTMWH